jgi:hypothetical protein
VNVFKHKGLFRWRQFKKILKLRLVKKNNLCNEIQNLHASKFTKGQALLNEFKQNYF